MQILKTSSKQEKCLSFLQNSSSNHGQTRLRWTQKMLYSLTLHLFLGSHNMSFFIYSGCFVFPPTCFPRCTLPHSNWPHWFCWCLQPDWSWTVAASDRHVFLSGAYGLRSLSSLVPMFCGTNCCDSAVWPTNICDVKNTNWEREDTIVLIFQIQMIQTYLSSRKIPCSPSKLLRGGKPTKEQLGTTWNHLFLLFIPFD